MQPMVSVCCVTYNHADTIAETLDAFLVQAADLPIEILVHDDCSTDGTQEILERYAAAHPDVIFPLFETENQYSRGVAMDATFNFPRARGEYIALCEGDDLWDDPHKLQKQVAAMRAHSDATFCFTNGTVHDVSGQQPDRAFLPYYESERAAYRPESCELTLGEVSQWSFLPTASFLFPTAALAKVPREMLLRPCPYGDLRLKLLLTAVGKAYYLCERTCVYRLNSAGSTMATWGSDAPEKLRRRCAQALAMLADVDRLSGGAYHDALQVLMDSHTRALVQGAPTPSLLRQPDARRVLRALPLPKRIKCRVKALIPDAWLTQ